MTGFLTLNSIKHDIPDNQAPIIFYTSHQEQEFIDRAFDLGCSGYVTKPIEADELIAVVNKSLA